MSSNGYRDSLSWVSPSATGLVSPFIRGSFTGDGITASQRCPVREHYILAYRE